jgi:hypothetical protein
LDNVFAALGITVITGNSKGKGFPVNTMKAYWGREV